MKEFDVPKGIRLKIAEDLKQDRLEMINSKLHDVKPRDTLYTRYIKRLFDILFSFIAVICTLPVNAVIAAITFFDVGHPIFFVQDRVGKNERLFKFAKFRNMRNDVNENGELLPPEKRVTKIGAFMRRSSLDELINFWYILKGDMSLIGPRPLLPEYTERYNKRHRKRLEVKPGLECPSWKRLDHVWTWQEQFDNDVWYVENVSLTVDIMMLIKLFIFAIDQKNAKARVNADRGIFMGYSVDGQAITMKDVDEYYLRKYEVK